MSFRLVCEPASFSLCAVLWNTVGGSRVHGGTRGVRAVTSCACGALKCVVVYRNPCKDSIQFVCHSDQVAPVRVVQMDVLRCQPLP